MNTIAEGQTYMIGERFDKAVKLIRSALAETRLSVVGELNTEAAFGKEPGKKPQRSRIFYVDCPLIAFEAQALDRAAAVFFPLHVFVRADGDRTLASAMSSADLFDVRLPLGAAGPLEKLQARVGLALESVLVRTGASTHGQRGGE
jgi:uncharacterized protein (DUF302 family)